jgi:hypothetical protein
MHVADGLNSLQGREAGKHVCIVGGGPSSREMEWEAPRFLRDPAYGNCAIIAINGAFQVLQRAPERRNYPPDYWLMLDYDTPRPDWFDAGYQMPCTKILSHTVREEYPDAIHAKVSTEEPELRSARLGLKMCDATEGGVRLEGTSAICAIHLAGILGASRVSMIGVDLMFGDKGKLHHPYPCRNYGEHATTSGQEMEPYKWRFGYDKETDKFAHTVYTCDWFRRSAFRIKEYMQFSAAQGMEVTDYSGGLLALV